MARFILFPCRRCGALAVADAGQKTRRCASCGLSNVLAKVVVIKRFDDKVTAMDALRLAKIPRGDRDGVPYAGGSSVDEGRRTTAEEIKAFFRTIRHMHPGGITEAEMLALARNEGLDVGKVKKNVDRCKREGTLLETGKQTLKFA